MMYDGHSKAGTLRARKAGAAGHDPDAVLFGQRLRATREAAGLSQSDLAVLVNTPQPRLPGIEQGRTDVRLSTVRRFARALRVPLSDLVSSD